MSLPIYLNHFIILYLVKAYASGISDNKKFIIYMIASLITPIITLSLAKLVSKGFTKLHTICFNKNTIKA